MTFSHFFALDCVIVVYILILQMQTIISLLHVYVKCLLMDGYI